MKLILMTLFVAISTVVRVQSLYNNAVFGGLTNEGLRTKDRPGGGSYSEVQSGNIGGGASFRTTAARCADDFFVTGNPWAVREISVWGFQPQANVPTIQFGQMDIRQAAYDGATVATGSFFRSEMTDIYRTFWQMPTDDYRLQRLRFRFKANLMPGHYWIVFFASGDVSKSGPWAPALTPVGALTVPGANAMQQVFAVYVHWESMRDPGSLVPLDLPFWIDGYRLQSVGPAGPVWPGHPQPDPVLALFGVR